VRGWVRVGGGGGGGGWGWWGRGEGLGWGISRGGEEKECVWGNAHAYSLLVNTTGAPPSQAVCIHTSKMVSSQNEMKPWSFFFWLPSSTEWRKTSLDSWIVMSFHCRNCDAFTSKYTRSIPRLLPRISMQPILRSKWPISSMPCGEYLKHSSLRSCGRWSNKWTMSTHRWNPMLSAGWWKRSVNSL